MLLNDSALGRIDVKTVPLPGSITSIQHPIYTPHGNILLGYKTDDDPADKDHLNIGIINDDGSDFHTIYSGSVPIPPTANGLRLMPYADGRRVLLGDYVLECTPSLLNCQQAELLFVKYPQELMKSPAVTHHWSEIVIAPDGLHMAWTSLTHGGALNFLGRLEREQDHYVVRGVSVISTIEALVEDKKHPGCIKASPLRGGEIKQFIKGGTWLSLAGSSGAALPDSVIQALNSEVTEAVTHLPSYEETTIFSPDERLGVVMSTRFSPKTNMSILGLMPRPYSGMVTQSLAQHSYMYAVAAVRYMRKGNIGPALIEIDKSQNQPGYTGINLSDQEENWVYYSPMSWHPNGKSAIWPEGLRGSREMRIRIARLPDYQPGNTVPPTETPDKAPYSRPMEEGLAKPTPEPIDGRIAGKHSGQAFYSRGKSAGLGQPMHVSMRYEEFSDDGKTFYNGQESVLPGDGGETIYRAQLKATGEHPGEMNLQLWFGPVGFTQPARLLYTPDADGKPKTRGFVTYGGETICAEDLPFDE